MKKTVLIITHVQPLPANAGDSLRLRNLIRFFKEQEYQVVCVFKDWFSAEGIEEELNGLIDHAFFCRDYKNFLTKLNKPYKILKIIQQNKIKACFDSLHMHVAVKKLYRHFKPTVVVAEYIFMAPYLKHIPTDVLKIIDTIDVFSRKSEEVCRHGIEFPLACSKKEERRYLLNGDLIMGIQPDETSQLKELVPEKRVVNVGVDMPVKRPDYYLQQSEQKVVLIVAGGNPNNVHGVVNFLKTSWKKIHRNYSDVRLRIVGSVCSHIDADLLSKGVELIGIVEDLDAEYQLADIVVNPVVAGTGLKIKTIEAISYCRPVVSTPNGVEGISLEKDEQLPFVIAESDDDFVEKVSELIESEKIYKDYQSASKEYAMKYLDKKYVYKELKNELEKWSRLNKKNSFED